MFMKYGVIFIAIVLALLTRLILVSVYKMPTSAMAPLLRTGDYVLASQISYQLKTPFQIEPMKMSDPQRGDLVVFTKSAKTLIRRVLALPGETVAVLSGVVTINNQPCFYSDGAEYLEAGLIEKIENCQGAQHAVLQPLGEAQKTPDLAPTELGARQYLVMSENRSSEDNTHVIEIISFDQIIGKPLFIWMSYSSTQDFISGDKGIQWNRILTKLK